METGVVTGLVDRFATVVVVVVVTGSLAGVVTSFVTKDEDGV